MNEGLDGVAEEDMFPLNNSTTTPPRSETPTRSASEVDDDSYDSDASSNVSDLSTLSKNSLQRRNGLKEGEFSPAVSISERRGCRKKGGSSVYSNASSPRSKSPSKKRRRELRVAPDEKEEEQEENAMEVDDDPDFDYTQLMPMWTDEMKFGDFITTGGPTFFKLSNKYGDGKHLHTL